MLSLDIPELEFFDNLKQEFISIPAQHLLLEHSLISVSKWEAKWKKSFLSYENKTKEMLADYIRQMTINRGVDDRIYSAMPEKSLNQIISYIEDPMTATTFSTDQKRRKVQTKFGQTKIITSEVLYYQMFSLQIPIECEKWHLNRLLTLLRVFDAKSNPKKMSKSEVLRQNAAINAARRARLKTKG